MKVARLIFCLAAASLSAGCASSSATSSAPQISTVDKSFLAGIGSYDANRDGVVTCDEWRAEAANMFSAVNKSGNGALTEDEFLNLARTDRTFLVAGFKYYDVNGDRKIDRKEFVERPNPAFAYADQDKDCRLTEPEKLTARNLSAPPAPVSTGRPSAIGNGQPTGSGGGY